MTDGQDERRGGAFPVDTPGRSQRASNLDQSEIAAVGEADGLMAPKNLPWC